MSKRVLFLPTNLASLREFDSLAVELFKVGIKSVFLLPYQLENLNYILKAPENKIIRFKNPRYRLPHLVFKICAILRMQNKLIQQVLSKVNYIQYFNKKLQKIIIKENITLSCIVADRHFIGGLEPALIKVSKSNDVKIVIPPNGMYMDKPSLFYTRKSQEYDPTKFQSYIPKDYEIAFSEKLGRYVSFFDEATLLAFEKVGIEYKNPWAPGGSHADYVLVENEKDRQRFIADGCSPEKLIVTGSQVNERALLLMVHKLAIKEKLKQKYNLDPDFPVSCLALPQLKEHKMIEQADHQEEINFLLRSFAQDGKNAFVSLHPRMNKSEYVPLIQTYGLTLLEERIDDTLPAFDLLVAGNSSIINRAIICSIPSLIVDFQDLDLKYLENIPGIKIIRNKEEFSKIYKQLTKDRTLLNSFQKELASFNGKNEHDLQATRNILTFFRTLL